MKLSIVATLYRSAPHLHEFHRRASAAARLVAGDDYELLLVDDGSPDDGLAQAVALARDDGRLVVVGLSRNFGHHAAMLAGLAHARGDRVFLIDSDLEEDPAWVEPFAALMDAASPDAVDAIDVVFGVQSARKGGRLERWSGALYYHLLDAISDLDMPHDMTTARLMTRRYVDALLLHRERDFDIGGLWALTGFTQRAVPVVKHSTSSTTYTLRRRVALLVDAVVAFSTAPLTAIVVVGALVMAVAAIAFVALLFDARISSIDGLLASLWLVGGAVVLSIGIVGVYVGRILSEVKRRPNHIVRSVHGRHGD